jgi:hypothetical protein
MPLPSSTQTIAGGRERRLLMALNICCCVDQCISALEASSVSCAMRTTVQIGRVRYERGVVGPFADFLEARAECDRRVVSC